MKLVYLDNELDSSIEHELFAENEELGFNVEIKYSEESWYTTKIQKFFNCTEVHHMFASILEDERVAIAFESDIHGTGCTRKIKDIESVTITLATEINSKYSEI